MGRIPPLPPVRRSPVLGANQDGTIWGLDRVEHEGKTVASGEQSVRTHGLPPGVIVPPTVLLTELDNGTLVLQGRPDGPRGYVAPEDAGALNRELAPLAMRIMEGSASVAEQQNYAQRLIAAGERLWRRAGEAVETTVIEGEVLESEPLSLSGRTGEPYREP